MPGVLLIGYDTEFGSDDVPPGLGPPDATVQFLEAAATVHRDTGTSATLFLCGQTIEQNIAELRPLAEEGLFDLQQHTYSHQRLKPLWSIPEGQELPEWCAPGMSLEEIREEVSKTCAILRDELEADCTGLTAPCGCYLGLIDRPDILAVLHDLGIRFTRTVGRDWRGAFYLAPGARQEKIQPFWYDDAGFGDILEFPMHGNDYNVRKEMGWENSEGYLAWTKRQIDDVAEREVVWSYAIHDHSAIRNDPELTLVRALLEYALEREVTVRSYREEYLIRMDERGA